MKAFSITLLVMVSLFASFSCTSQDENTTQINNGDIVEVFYFHFTRRCITCNAVESESKKAIESLFADQIKSGKVVFKSINLDDDSSKSDAEKCGVSGQSLLVVSGDKKVDLTSIGFMNAKSKPEKLKDELQKAINSML